MRTYKMILPLLLLHTSTCVAWSDIEGHMLPKSNTRTETIISNSSSPSSADVVVQTHLLTDPAGFLAASRQEVMISLIF